MGQGGPSAIRGIAVTPERSSSDNGRVVPFRRPGAPRWLAPQHAESPDDYRHRMTMNLLGFLVTIVLIVAGLWLVDKIAEFRKAQDCYLSGRRNCAPIEVPRIEHD